LTADGGADAGGFALAGEALAAAGAGATLADSVPASETWCETRSTTYFFPFRSTTILEVEPGKKETPRSDAVAEAGDGFEEDTSPVEVWEKARLQNMNPQASKAKMSCSGALRRRINPVPLSLSLSLLFFTSLLL
jgi:hypothetical protein